MILSVPANYDPHIVPRLAQHPVYEVYGKLPADFVGGGRASCMASRLSWRELTHYVQTLRTHGIAFNYLLNAACLGGREFGRRWQRALDRLLGRLAEIGVAHLTISTPLLLEIVKRRFGQFRVRVGIYAMVDSPRRARFWQELGADVITVNSNRVNRQFERLAAIRSAVSCPLELIANHPCLLDCPLMPYHANGFAHASDGSGRLFIDWCFLRCSRLRLQQPAEFIRSAWIRPEDVGVYERMGYDRLKLLERGIPSDQLLRRVQAYSERRFEGNLAELLMPNGFRPPRRGRLWALRHFFRPREIRTGFVLRLRQLAKDTGLLYELKASPIVIESREIPPDFLQQIEARRCELTDCRKCGYCDSIAAKTVRVDPQWRQRALAQYAPVEAAMAERSAW